MVLYPCCRCTADQRAFIIYRQSGSTERIQNEASMTRRQGMHHKETGSIQSPRCCSHRWTCCRCSSARGSSYIGCRSLRRLLYTAMWSKGILSPVRHSALTDGLAADAAVRADLHELAQRHDVLLRLARQLPRGRHDQRLRPARFARVKSQQPLTAQEVLKALLSPRSHNAYGLLVLAACSDTAIAAEQGS